MMDIQISWRAGKEFPAPSRSKLRALISAVTESACPGLLRVSLSFLSPERMAEINERHLGHHGPTDVICFDYRGAGMPDEEDTPQVELFLCPAVAAREAAKRGLAYSRELTLYIVHGFLHAGGFDDLKPELKRRMRAAERRVCGKIPDELSGIFLFHPGDPTGKGGQYARPA